jgi:hypothetical protein
MRCWMTWLHCETTESQAGGKDAPGGNTGRRRRIFYPFSAPRTYLMSRRSEGPAQYPSDQGLPRRPEAPSLRWRAAPGVVPRALCNANGRIANLRTSSDRSSHSSTSGHRRSSRRLPNAEPPARGFDNTPQLGRNCEPRHGARYRHSQLA